MTWGIVRHNDVNWYYELAADRTFAALHVIGSPRRVAIDCWTRELERAIREDIAHQEGKIHVQR